MICPFCSSETKVVDKRDSLDFTRRRRECLKCNKRFTTYERFELPNLYVIKKDNRREPFNKEKIKLGIIKACEKRPISQAKIDKIINNIELKLRNKNLKEIKSKIIGNLVISYLKKLDKVAYIRFASVYREFQDIKEFAKEVK